MSVKAELIVQAVVAVLGAVDGTGDYTTDLRGRVYEDNSVEPVSGGPTPHIMVGFESISRATGLRERSIGITIDALVDADHIADASISPQAALLRIERDIEVALYQARYTVDLLSHQTFEGANRVRGDDGQTRTGVTMRFSFVFTEDLVE